MFTFEHLGQKYPFSIHLALLTLPLYALSSNNGYVRVLVTNRVFDRLCTTRAWVLPMTTQPISGLIRDGCCYHQPMPPLLLPNSFSIDQFLDQTGAGPAIQKSFQPTDCRPNGGGSTQHLQPTDFWTKRGRVLLPNHLFNRPIFGPHGGGCCYPTIFSTDQFLNHMGAGAATQPFFHPTDFWITQERALLPNIHQFTQNDDTPIEPPYTPTDHPQNLRHQLIHQ